MRALAPGTPQIHAEAPGNVIRQGQVKTAGFERRRGRATTRSASTPVRTGRTQRRWRRAPAHAAYDAATGRVALTCTTQMPHLARTAIRRRARHAGVRPTRHRARRRRRLRPENVAVLSEYVVVVWLARKLKSSVAWTEDRRENLIAGFIRAINTSRSKAPSTTTPSCSRSGPTSSPMSALIRAFPPPAASSR